MYKWTKYAIIKIAGLDEGSINQCLRLMERRFPVFLHRKEYIRRAKVTLFKDEGSIVDSNYGSKDMFPSPPDMTYWDRFAEKN